jgi:hypothetical protein
VAPTNVNTSSAITIVDVVINLRKSSTTTLIVNHARVKSTLSQTHQTHKIAILRKNALIPYTTKFSRNYGHNRLHVVALPKRIARNNRSGKNLGRMNTHYLPL